MVQDAMASDAETKREGTIGTIDTINMKDAIAHVEKTDTLLDLAQLGNQQEHSLQFLEALRIYRKGVTFALLITMTIIMRQYDINIVNNFFALPAFRNHFGHPVPGNPSAAKQIPAPWQVALGISSLVGQVIGAMLVPWPMEWWGRRKTLAVCLCITACLTFMQFFATTIEVLTASEYLSGVIFGAYQVLVVTYSAELLPVILRPYLAAYVSVYYSIGGLLISGISKGFDDWTTDWGYRIPFAIQWVWPIIILPILYFTPESPWWLLRQDRLEEATKALTRLSSPDPKVNINSTLAMMKKIDLYERKLGEGATIKDCFKGSNRRRTHIVIMIFFAQVFAQSAISPTYFFQQLGLNTAQSFDMGLGISAVGLVCALSSAFLLRYFGRRRIYTVGISIMAVLQLTVGFLDLAPNYKKNHAFGWSQVSLLVVASAVYHLSIGPLSTSILTDIPSVKLRAKTVGIAISVDALMGIVRGIATPYLVNPGEANARGKTDFLFGGLSVISALWNFYCLPETKNRTYEELDYMFENKVPTRGFKTYVIDEDVLKHDLEE